MAWSLHTPTSGISGQEHGEFNRPRLRQLRRKAPSATSDCLSTFGLLGDLSVHELVPTVVMLCRLRPEC
jgi:hypothetical protein